MSPTRRFTKGTDIEVTAQEPRLPALERPEEVKLRRALVERIHLWGAERVVRSLTALYQATEMRYVAERKALEARDARDVAFVSLEEKDKLVERERRRIRNEIEAGDLKDQIEREQLEDELEGIAFQREFDKINREVALIRKQLELDRLKEPQQQEKRSKLGKELDRISERRQYIDELDELRDELLKQAGVETEEELDPIRSTMLQQARDAVALGVEG